MTRYLQRLVARTPGRAEARPLAPPVRVRSTLEKAEPADPFETVAPPATGFPARPAFGPGWPGAQPSEPGWPRGHAPEPGSDIVTREEAGAARVTIPAPTPPPEEALLAPPPGEPVGRPSAPSTVPSRPDVLQPTEGSSPPALPPIRKTEAPPGSSPLTRTIAKPVEQEPGAPPEASPLRPAGIEERSPPLQAPDSLAREADAAAPTLPAPLSPTLPRAGQTAPPAAIEPPRPLLPPSTARDERPEDNAVRVTPDLRPPSPPPLAGAPEQPRVVIGRLRVEVVPTSTPDSSPRSKLRFGLGQL